MSVTAVALRLFLIALLAACHGAGGEPSRVETGQAQSAKRTSGRLIHVLVALCDNRLNEDGEKVRKRAAAAYNQYQRCGMNAAMRLFASGW